MEVWIFVSYVCVDRSSGCVQYIVLECACVDVGSYLCTSGFCSLSFDQAKKLE